MPFLQVFSFITLQKSDTAKEVASKVRRRHTERLFSLQGAVLLGLGVMRAVTQSYEV